MEKKNIIKMLLISLAVVGLIYLIVDHFNEIGTSEGNIDYYDMSADINARVDSLPSSWSGSPYFSFRSILSDIDVAAAMQGMDEESARIATNKVGGIFGKAADSYFGRGSWIDLDLSQIKFIAAYLHNSQVVRTVDGYHEARKLIASSKTCATTAAVDNCIAKAASYNKSPWNNCKELKDGLSRVRSSALESYTNRSLIPLCDKLVKYKVKYTYFDDFDRDYQKVRKGKEYLEKKSYSNAAFLSRYNSIKYNNAANDLDPRF